MPDMKNNILSVGVLFVLSSVALAVDAGAMDGEPVLRVASVPGAVDIEPFGETAFDVTLANTGTRWVDANLWFRLPDGIEVVDGGGTKFLDFRKSATYTVKLKANSSARQGTYTAEVSGNGRDAKFNWYTFTIRIGGQAESTASKPVSQTTARAPGYDTLLAIGGAGFAAIALRLGRGD
ncbi:MAG TPA: hypothetical protein HA257_05070 [Candidatus Methanoperedenaceae archaeon]|nr:hypothetical protein [Candidatus Methanoperedenaceae archaeon]